MKKIRFWLSRLIFEKIFGWPAAQEVGRKIVQEVDAWNSEHSGKCRICGSKELIEDRCGSEGIFSSVHHFNRCKKCGNTQDLRPFEKYDWEELCGKRITRDGYNQFRYSIFTDLQWVVVIILLIFAVAVGLTFFYLSIMY